MAKGKANCKSPKVKSAASKLSSNKTSNSEKSKAGKTLVNHKNNSH